MSIGGTGASSQRIETSADDTTSFQEPVLPHWDVSTAASRAEWSQARLDARNRFKAEAKAAQLGQVLPPMRNPSTAMLLYYNYLMARRGWEQQVVDSGTSSASTSTNLLASSSADIPGLHVDLALYCMSTYCILRTQMDDNRHQGFLPS